MPNREDYPAEQHTVDITELAVLGEQFPLRLMQLGFRLMQVLNETKRDLYRYVLPPVCEIPAGPFLMGSDKRRDPHALKDERPQQEIILPTFQIGVYPLTYAEYAYADEVGDTAEYTCADDSGIATAMWYWKYQLDRPVDSISWHQAMGYAAWLSSVTGQTWRLPTEAEWEKAARGTDGRIYPWGDQWDPTRANIRGSDRGGHLFTTPVGSYPQGASPYGSLDMAGNVSEWTSSRHRLDQPYRHEQAVKDARSLSARVQSHRVHRGGSYMDEPENVRAAYRGREDPINFLDTLGMRLVLDVGAATV